MSCRTSRSNSRSSAVPPEQLVATESRIPTKRTKAAAVVLLVALMSFFLLPPGWSVAEDSASSNEGSDETGIQVASWALTVPYAIGKGAFALGGAVVGSLSYLFSGGNLDSAKAVWITSIDGTYVLRPAHLRGEEPIQFLGKTDSGQHEPAPHPVEPIPGTSEPAKK